MFKLNYTQITEIKNELQYFLKTGRLNNQKSNFVRTLNNKLSRWFDDQLFIYLINKKKNFYNELVDKLDIFDLTSLDDVSKNYPDFKLNSMYLAGGMDSAVNAGMGWRGILEYEFEFNHPGYKKSKFKEIEILYHDRKIICHPTHTVDSDNLNYLLENPKKILKLYDKPALLNPVRKEADRSNDDNFDIFARELKNKDYNPIINDKPIKYFRKLFSESIEPADEHLLRISDAVFLGLDRTAGAGTNGELELLSLIRKPLFCWLINQEENNVGFFKLWNFPHLCKLARNIDEMKILVDTISKYSKK